MALPSSGNITLSAIQTEFGSTSLRAAAVAAGLATLSGNTLTPPVKMRDFLGKSSFTATLYDYSTTGTYTWVKPSGANTMAALVIAGGGGGGGSYYAGRGGGGGGGQAYYFTYSLSGIAGLDLVIGTGGAQRPNGNSQGNNGGVSSMSITGGSALVACNGGIGGFGSDSSMTGSGGNSGAGYAGGAGNTNDTSGYGGGGGGNAGAGSDYSTGVGGASSTYTINGTSYVCSPGGFGGGYTGTGTPANYGQGGDGAEYNGTSRPGQAGRQGRIVFYVTP
jgi:hypothetical protein